MIEGLEPLITENGITSMMLRDVDLEDHWWQFEVHEVTCWSNEDEVLETELYLNASIKWDGCSNLNFNGLHLCTDFNWKMHIKTMEAIWDLAPKKIKNFDLQCAGLATVDPNQTSLFHED